MKLKRIAAWGVKLVAAWCLLGIVLSLVALWLSKAAREVRLHKPAVVITADGRRVAAFVDPRTGDRYGTVPEADFERAQSEYGLVPEAAYRAQHEDAKR